MHFQHPVISEQLLDRAIDSLPSRTHGIHGLTHWLRVERNGLYLASSVDADLVVVSLFALFHDCRRFNDGADPDHGARGARLAEELYWENQLTITEDQLHALVFACERHTDTTFTDIATVGCCWDADRLDLTRLGIAPEPGLLNTDPARKLAGSQNFEPLEHFNLNP